jgi:ABC-2 type transport system permease protein
MRKLLAVIRREYIQRVRTRFFVVATILGPAMMVGFAILPPLMSGIKAGGPMRLAIVDQTGKMYERVARELTNGKKLDKISAPVGTNNTKEQVDQAGKLFQRSFLVEEVHLDNRSLDQLRNQLESRVQTKDLDGYILLPPNLLKDEQPEFRTRNSADLLTQSYVQDSISRAVRGQRLVEAGIREPDIERASEPVNLRITGAGGAESKGGQASSYFVFGTGLLIYMCVLLYGQLVLGAVIDEKETRIAEILFSSMRSFPLMMGKLIGVSLVAMTQLGIWGLGLVLFTLFGVGTLAAKGVPISLPHIPAMVFVYFVLYFLLGYFIYATLYAVVGSMVTTTQEGGQLALPVVLLLVAGFYFSFSIIRNPNSPLAFWASMFPFFAPITMLARIVTETPPLWQILLSLGIGIATAVGLIWLASRIYRVGMLMTGKKATIPEVMRWVRQA